MSTQRDTRAIVPYDGPVAGEANPPGWWYHLSVELAVRAAEWLLNRSMWLLILLVFRILFLLLRGFLHGFGAIVRWLWRDPGVKALFALAVALYLFQGAEAKGWFGKDTITAYNLTDSDFSVCPPGHRLNPNPISRLNPFAPNCIPVKEQDEVLFGDDITNLLSHFALAGMQKTEQGSKMKGWFDWLKMWLDSTGQQNKVQEGFNRLDTRLGDLRNQVLGSELHMKQAVDDQLGKLNDKASETERKLGALKNDIDALNLRFSKEIEQARQEYVVQSQRLEDLLVAALDERDKEGVLKAQQVENSELKQKLRDCERALDITEKLLQEFRERDRRHMDWTPDDALAEFFDSINGAAGKYLSPKWWWNKLRKYSSVWMSVRFMTRVAWWMAQAAWWQILMLFMICGNLFVVTLNLLLMCFRVVDDTVSISGRLVLLVRAIVSVCFQLFFNLGNLWWAATRWAVNGLMGRKPEETGNVNPPNRGAPENPPNRHQRRQRTEANRARRETGLGREREELAHRLEGALSLLNQDPDRQGVAQRRGPSGDRVIHSDGERDTNVVENEDEAMHSSPETGDGHGDRRVIVTRRPRGVPRSARGGNRVSGGGGRSRDEGPSNLSRGNTSEWSVTTSNSRRSRPRERGRNQPRSESPRTQTRRLLREAERDLTETESDVPPRERKCGFCGSTEHCTSDCDIGLWGVRPLSQPNSPRSEGGNSLAVGQHEVQGTNVEEEFAFWAKREDSDVPTKLHYVKCLLGETKQTSSLLVDTGSAVSVLPRRSVQKLGLVVQPAGRGTRLIGFAGKREDALGTVAIPVKIGKNTKILTFFVTENANKPILGLDALKEFRLILDLNDGTLITPSKEKIFCHAVAVVTSERVAVEEDDKEEGGASSSGSKN